MDGKLKWRVNLDAIINNYQDLASFPKFDTKYEGPTLFVGGEKSEYIRWDVFSSLFYFPLFNPKMCFTVLNRKITYLLNFNMVHLSNLSDTVHVLYYKVC